MKPYAYSYSRSYAETPNANEPWNWDAALAYGSPPYKLIQAGRVRDVTPLYSRAQVAQVRARAALEYKKKRVRELDSIFGAYGGTLRPFLGLMAKELEANSHKGNREGWLGMTVETAMGEVDHHREKLRLAINKGDPDAIKEHAADVANCCMMLLDTAGLL